MGLDQENIPTQFGTPGEKKEPSSSPAEAQAEARKELNRYVKKEIIGKADNILKEKEKQNEKRGGSVVEQIASPRKKMSSLEKLLLAQAASIAIPLGGIVGLSAFS